MEEALTSLLASVAGGHRYWVRAPQTVNGAPVPYPRVILNRVGGTPDYVMAGPSGYVASRVQVDVYAETFGALIATERAIVTLVSGYKGVTGTTRIQGIFIDAIRNLPAEDAGSVNHLFRTTIDLMVHHSPA